MTSTQTTVNARTARELAADLDLDCTVATDGEQIVVTLANGEIEACDTLEDACNVIRQYARS